MPPPNTDKEIPRERFEHTNPRLTLMQGGIDPNRRRPNKKEVVQNLPRKDAGANVWGDQLYADRRRQEILTRVARDTWMNRNGDYSVEPFDDRKPVGYVGFQPAYRPLPYLPATQRASLASRRGWTGIPTEQVPAPGATDQIFPRIATRKPDASTCARDLNINGSTSDYVIYPGVDIHDTNRQTTGTIMVPGIVDGTHGDANLTHSGYHENVRPPLTEEEETLTLGAAGEVSNGVVVVDPGSLRATLKAAMEGTFSTGGANASETGPNVVVDRDVRSTQKTMMQETFPTTTADGDHTSSYVVMDKDIRATQKGLMQDMFPTTTADGEHTANYVMLDPNARPTLKTMMQETFPTTTADGDHTSSYVVIDRDARPTLKPVTMDEMFPTSNANDEATSNYVVIDRTARPTLKPVTMDEMFPTTNAGNESTGEYIEFQGEILPTNRMNYETEGHRPSAYDETVGTNTTKNAEFAHIDPTRGTSDTNWMTVSRVPAQTEDTSTRWIPKHTQETERSMQNRFPLPTKRSMQEHRVLPVLNTTSCAASREDSQVEPIRWLNPTYYTEATSGGR
jgi:hypothetical protein